MLHCWEVLQGTTDLVTFTEEITAWKVSKCGVFSGTYFPEKTPENTDQENSVFGRFSGSESLMENFIFCSAIHSLKKENDYEYLAGEGFISGKFPMNLPQNSKHYDAEAYSEHSQNI